MQRLLRWRRPIAVTALVLACIVTPLAAVSVFATSQMLDTKDYVDAVEPLATNQAIERAVARRLLDGFYRLVNVPADKRPELEQAVDRFISSDEFQSLWAVVNRFAHRQLVKLLTGRGGEVTIEGGRVTLNLGPMVREVNDYLNAQGVHDFDEIATKASGVRLTIFKSSAVPKLRSGVRLLDTLTWVLPWVSLALFAAAILFWPSRLRGLFWAGAGLAISSGVVVAALSFGRWEYLRALPERILPDDAAAALLDAVTDDFFTALRVGLGIGIAVALAVVALDLLVKRDLFTDAHRRDLLGAALLGVVLVVLAAWGRPPIAATIALIGALVAGIVAIRLLVPERPAAGAGAPAPPAASG